MPPTADKSPAPARLKLGDVRKMFRLIGEVRELGADPNEWRPHMVRKLRSYLGASIVVSSEVHFRRAASSSSVNGDKAAPMRVIDIGWVSDPSGEVSRIDTERDDASPDSFWLSARNSDEESLVSVKPVQKVYGGTAFILSQIPLPHAGAVDQLGIHREWGDRPFSAAEHRLVRMFHVELARLWKRDVLRRAKEPTSDLPPRLAQTLDELLRGASEKQIAARLEISHHTVHNYVKALHQRFGVSSRGELLAKAGAVRSETAPRLSLSPERGSKSRA